MDERDFEILDMLRQTGNITKAADQLFVTQSALSKRISQIEREVGVTVILRSKHGVRFTPEGEVVLKYTEEAAESLRNMRERLDTLKDYLCGTLHAGVSVNYSQYDLPDLLMKFHAQYPHVHTHILTDQSRHLFAQLTEGALDVAIVRGEFPWHENKILLSRERIYAITGKDAADTPLDSLPYIARKSDAAYERTLSQWMREQNLHIDPDSGIKVGSISTCVAMVERGLGWSIVPEIGLKDFSGTIRPLYFANGEPLQRSTYLLYGESAEKLPQVKAFIEAVKENQR